MKTQRRNSQKEEEEELDIRIQFESGEQRDEAMERLYKLMRPGLVSFLERKHVTLSIEDQLSVIHDSFNALNQKLVACRVDLNAPLPPLLLTMIDRKAIDLIRSRNGKRKPSIHFDEGKFMDAITALDWKRKNREGRAEEIMEQLRAFVATTSGLTKAVGEAMVHLIPPEPSPEELKEAVEGIIGKPTTISSVSSTLSRLRKELRTIIQA